MSSVRAAAMALALVAAVSARAQEFRLPTHPPPAQFGNVLISRTTFSGPVRPVLFPHAIHRIRYTCRVCHLELGFALRHNATEISEDANRKGAFCGACHDGRTAFGVSEPNCARCHTGTADADQKMLLDRLQGLPVARFGNGVDWSKALATGAIHPVSSLLPDFQPMELDTTLSLEADWSFVPPAIFPHAEHVRWLDCANCHPDLFNVKKKTTRHFSMKLNLAREFCGACHVRVAFPLDDCKRCHPTMSDAPFQE